MLFDKIANRQISYNDSILENVYNIVYYIWRHQSNDLTILHSMIMFYEKRIKKAQITRNTDYVSILMITKKGVTLELDTKDCVHKLI